MPVVTMFTVCDADVKPGAEIVTVAGPVTLSSPCT